MAGIAVVVVVLAGAGYYLVTHGIGVAHAAPVPAAVVRQFIYTPRTANDASITLPATVKDELRQIGLNHQSIALTRVDSAGNASTSVIDMTPRTGNGTVLKVASRAGSAIDKKISVIQNAINSPAATGGQALYAGLTKTDFTGVPVTIISSGLDLADPDNFRALNWSVPAAAEVVADVKKAGDQPALHGPVTFVTVPTAGPQPQLGQAQKNYRNNLWTALLTAAGATHVTFIGATGTTASPEAPNAPTIPVPGQPGTPIPRVPKGENSVTCTVSDSYFIFGTATLIDPAQTMQDLTPCVHAALAAHAVFALDGWASYEGPLNANGQPAFHYPGNRKLSQARVQTIAGLLVNGLGVPRSAITRLTGHGDVNQPDPDPRSPANRVVVITYTIK